MTVTSEELWDKRGEIMTAAIAEHARTGASGIPVAESASARPEPISTSIEELWERRGEIYAAGLSNPRRPEVGLPLAEALPSDQKSKLARELRETAAARRRKVTVTADPAKARDAVIERAHATARTAIESMVRDRRTISESVDSPAASRLRWARDWEKRSRASLSESAPDCVCLRLGFGGTCPRCG